MIKGYAVNQKRLDVLNKTIAIQSRILASTLNIEEKEVLSVVEAYSNALTLLDDYDHGTIPKPDGIASIYHLTYEECRELIAQCCLTTTAWANNSNCTFLRNCQAYIIDDFSLVIIKIYMF